MLACSSGAHVMTIDSFHEVAVGDTPQELLEISGKPYAIHKKADGSEEYEYIERIKAGGRNLEERHYYFLVKEGKVVSKRVEQRSPPPYNFDSYEMQTTFN